MLQTYCIVEDTSGNDVYSSMFHFFACGELSKTTIVNKGEAECSLIQEYLVGNKERHN